MGNNDFRSENALFLHSAQLEVIIFEIKQIA